MSQRPDTGDKTIADFGEQWLAFQENKGYYSSQELFRDFLVGLVTMEELAGSRVADIGSGTGRIVAMLLEAGVAHVTAVEPSASFGVLQREFAAKADRVTCVHDTGDKLPSSPLLDYVFSFGVLHHIPDPQPTVRVAWTALKPGGKIVVWVYGREGNGLYLAIAQPLRLLTRHLPHRVLTALCAALWLPVRAYAVLCRLVQLPMSQYLRNVYCPLRVKDQILVIYDQLNPSYTKYYRRREAQELLEKAGFVDIQLVNRHGYGWTMVGQKPTE